MNKSSSSAKKPLLNYCLVDNDHCFVIKYELKLAAFANSLNVVLARSKSPHRWIPASNVPPDYTNKVKP